MIGTKWYVDISICLFSRKLVSCFQIFYNINPIKYKIKKLISSQNGARSICNVINFAKVCQVKSVFTLYLFTCLTCLLVNLFTPLSYFILIYIYLLVDFYCSDFLIKSCVCLSSPSASHQISGFLSLIALLQVQLLSKMNIPYLRVCRAAIQ